MSSQQLPVVRFDTHFNENKEIWLEEATKYTMDCAGDGFDCGDCTLKCRARTIRDMLGVVFP